MAEPTFRSELEALLNKHSMENRSATPDWILADYLSGCLANFDKVLAERTRWYNAKTGPSFVSPGEEQEYEIWSEGFVATGQRGQATLHSRIKATSFREACFKLARKDAEFEKYFDANRLTFWGCRLFDNEREARKSFG